VRPELPEWSTFQVDWLARDKHSRLLQKSVNYGQKSFITLAPGEEFGLQVRTFLYKKRVLSQNKSNLLLPIILYNT
jgi:hypothetical protein